MVNLKKNLLLKLLVLLVSCPAFAGQYDEALSKFKEAFLIQSGIQANIQLVKDYTAKAGEFYAREIGIERELAATAFAYKVYKEKSIRIPLGQDSITIGKDSAQISLHF